MKLNELDQNQATAIKAIIRTYNTIVGGAENTLLDYDETDDEYIEAKKLLNSPKELVDFIYQDLMATEGYTYSKEIRFCGTEWIKERIARRLKKEGYYPDYQKRSEYDLKAKQ
jgi:hypothetical protein